MYGDCPPVFGRKDYENPKDRGLYSLAATNYLSNYLSPSANTLFFVKAFCYKAVTGDNLSSFPAAECRRIEVIKRPS
jgi:hypothetical protein